MKLLLDPNTAFFTASVFYACMALLVWTLLVRRHAALPIALWTGGCLSLCLAVAMLALGPVLPGLPVKLRVLSANNLVLVGFLMRAAALRHERGLPRPLLPWRLLLSCLAASLLLLTLAPTRLDSLYTLGSHALFQVVMIYGVWQAWQIGRQQNSGAAWLLVAVELSLVLALLVRSGAVIAAWPDGRADRGWSFVLIAAVFLLSGVVSNVAYLGLVLDRNRAAAARARDAQVAEAARRGAAEQHAAELQRTLAQRDRLAEERQQLLQVLAHEIRQPLHNASGALQAAGLALSANTAESLEQAGQRVRRADAVLGDVHSALDNTLAATSLLTRVAPLTLQEMDLGLLVELALGDLPKAERTRVQVQWLPGFCSAELEPGLVRLALRNLLRNAFGHGGPDAAVTLRVDERDDPPALWLTVLDTGRGAPAQLLQPGPGAAEAALGTPRPLRGLGLFIARRVMALHGGELVLAENSPQGLQASLVFPLPGAEPALP